MDKFDSLFCNLIEKDEDSIKYQYLDVNLCNSNEKKIAICGGNALFGTDGDTL